MCLSVLFGKNLLPFPNKKEVHSDSVGRFDVAVI